MTAMLMFAAALMAPSAGAPAGTAPTEVAYDQLAEGPANAAIARLRTNADDPAALINLGAAFSKKGMKAQALDCYRAAIASEVRYDVQFSGRWMDSRQAARVAAERVMQTSSLAMR